MYTLAGGARAVLHRPAGVQRRPADGGRRPSSCCRSSSCSSRCSASSSAASPPPGSSERRRSSDLDAGRVRGSRLTAQRRRHAPGRATAGPDSTCRAGLTARAGPGAGHARLGAGRRRRRLPRPPRRRRRRRVRAARDRRAVGAPGSASAADRHHRHARAAAWYTVAAVAAVDDHGQPTERAGPAPRRSPTATASAASASTRRRRRSAAPAVAADDRRRAPVAARPRASARAAGTIGDEFAEALRLAHDELGVRAVRAHAILHDDLGVYREVDGEPVHDFSGVDRIYDRVLDLGLRPIVEVSFMPADLASDPDEDRVPLRRDRVAAARTGSLGAPRRRPRRPPRRALRARRGAHVGVRDLERGQPRGVLGRARATSTCGSTTSARARSRPSTASLPVGGPASAAVGVDRRDARRHRRARAPRSTSCRRTRTATRRSTSARSPPATASPDLPLWWTEWGAHATHFNRAHDSVWSAAPTSSAAWSARWAASTPSPTGPCPTTSRSSGARRAAARRLRPAQRRQPAQAALVGAVDARTARRPRLADRGRRRRRRRHGRRRRHAGHVAAP